MTSEKQLYKNKERERQAQTEGKRQEKYEVAWKATDLERLRERDKERKKQKMRGPCDTFPSHLPIRDYQILINVYSCDT